MFNFTHVHSQCKQIVTSEAMSVNIEHRDVTVIFPIFQEATVILQIFTSYGPVSVSVYARLSQVGVLSKWMGGII